MLGFPVLKHLLKFAQTHVHWVGDAVQASCPLSSRSPPAFSLSQHQGLLQLVSSSDQVAKVLELRLQHQSFFTLLSHLPPSPRGSSCHKGGVICVSDVVYQINKKDDNIIVTFSLYRVLTRTFASKEGCAEASGYMHIKGVQCFACVGICHSAQMQLIITSLPQSWLS